MSRRRRRGAVVLAIAVLALGGAGCEQTLEEPAPLGVAPPEPSDACAAGRLPRLQAGTHLLGDTAPPVPWSSTPATSGWHASGDPSIADAPDPIADADLVAQLERGRVAALHGPGLPPDDVARLDELAATAHDGRLVVRAYAGELDAPLVLVGWGVLQSCEALDEAALTDFVLSYTGLAQAHDA